MDNLSINLESSCFLTAKNLIEDEEHRIGDEHFGFELVEKKEGCLDKQTVDWAVAMIRSISSLEKGSYYTFNKHSQSFEKPYFSWFKTRDSSSENLEEISRIFKSILKVEQSAYEKIEKEIDVFILSDQKQNSLKLEELIDLLSEYQKGFAEIRQSTESMLQKTEYLPKDHEAYGLSDLLKTSYSLEGLLESLQKLSRAQNPKAKKKAFAQLAKCRLELKNSDKISDLNYKVFLVKLFVNYDKLTLDQDPERALIQLAKHSANKGKYGLIHYKYLPTTNRVALKEIAKIDSKRIFETNGSFLQHISQAAKNEHVLIELAKLEAQQDGGSVSQHIKKYGIQEEKERIEIAKLAARQNGGIVSRFIKEYDIKDEKERIEIAKLAAQQNGLGISLYLQNYGIQEEKERIEIAKLAAQRNGAAVSEFIKNYKIVDQTALIEIAKIAAAQNGWGFSRSIEEYGVTDQTALIEIAKIAAAQNGRGVSEFIQNYKIIDQAERYRILMIAVLQNLKSFDCIENYKLDDDCYSLIREVARLCSNRFESSTAEKLAGLLETWANNQNLDLGILYSHLRKERNEQIFKEKTPLLMHLIVHCEFDQKKQTASWLNSHKIELETLFNYRNPARVRQIIGELLQAVAADPKALELYEKIWPEKKNRAGLIPNLLLAMLNAQGKLSSQRGLELGEKLAANPYLRKIKNLEALVEALTVLTQDAQKKQEDVELLLSLILPEIESLKPLANEELRKLSKEEKRARNRLFNKISKKNEKEAAEKALLQRALKGIYDFSKQEKLTKKNVVAQGNDLHRLFQEVFTQVHRFFE